MVLQSSTRKVAHAGLAGNFRFAQRRTEAYQVVWTKDSASRFGRGFAGISNKIYLVVSSLQPQ